MANEKHLAILRQGVPAWNGWRSADRDVHPDLAGADLKGMLLAGAHLGDANLARADLTGADLAGAYLPYADLHEAYLTGASLAGADLSDAYAASADLTKTDLDRADLGHATLRAANLAGAWLVNAVLRRAGLAGANLADAQLDGADLEGADLTGACLRNANLARANLRDARLDGADLTGANLWATDRTGWSIRGVACRRAFWDREGKEPTEYGEDEFERRFAEQPLLVLRHPGPPEARNLALLPYLLEYLQVQHPTCALQARALRDEGGGGTVVTIAVVDLTGRDTATFAAEVQALGDTLLAFQLRLVRDQELCLALEAGHRALVRDLLPRLAQKSS